MTDNIAVTERWTNTTALARHAGRYAFRPARYASNIPATLSEITTTAPTYWIGIVSLFIPVERFNSDNEREGGDLSIMSL